MLTMHPTLLIGPYDWDSQCLPESEFRERITAFWEKIPDSTISRAMVYGDSRNEADEKFFVILTGASNAVIGGSTTSVTIINDDAVPIVSVSNTNRFEGQSGTTTFHSTVSLSEPSDRTLTVNWQTADGTATAPTDYTSATGTLTFAPGVTSQTLDTLVNGDRAFEADETYFIPLSLLFSFNGSAGDETNFHRHINHRGHREEP